MSSSTNATTSSLSSSSSSLQRTSLTSLSSLTSPSTTSTISSSTSSISSSSISSISSSSQTPSTITSTTLVSNPATTKTLISTRTNSPTSSSSTTSTSSAAASSSSVGLAAPSSQGSGSAANAKTIAVATVVPIVGVALLVLAGFWLWRRHKERRNAEEMRRKEMEEYGFNPNNDPTIPAVASTNGDEQSTSHNAGYRGWGTTSTARKGSTTMSSHPGVARSDSGGRGYNGQPSPPVGVAQTDGHSGDPLMRNGADDLGALGAAPTASNNRGNGMNRGPSNASSAYSGANYSDVSAHSGDGPLPNASPQDYAGYVHPNEVGRHDHYGEGGWDGSPVIRDVSARRNTRIENPSVVPHQGNSGIAQNF